MHIHTPGYRKAFLKYLRRGTPIDVSLKEDERPTTHYIWHTQGDDKVRASHAANDGKIFAWDNPPETGNPGEDFGCRCWAEPLGGNYFVTQTPISPVNDSPDKWTNVDFVLHYAGQSGREVTLSETGYLGAVIEHYATRAISSTGIVGVYRAVEDQIMEKAKHVGSGEFMYSFNGNYSFQDNVLFILGESVVSGLFSGEVRKEQNFLVVTGVVTYDFSDKFRDPNSKVETLMDEEGLTREEAEARVGGSGDIFGVPYDITDTWQTKFVGTVALEQ